MSLGWCSLCHKPVLHVSASREGFWMGPCGHRGRMLFEKPIHWRPQDTDKETDR